MRDTGAVGIPATAASCPLSTFVSCLVSGSPRASTIGIGSGKSVQGFGVIERSTTSAFRSAPSKLREATDQRSFDRVSAREL